MANTKKRGAAGPKTEVFAMRLDPRLKYLAELAARKQRRSLASFVEWAMQEALAKVTDVAPPGKTHFAGHTIADLAPYLWQLDESDRLIALAESCPDLMTYEEQLIWRVIWEHGVWHNKELLKFTDENKVLKVTTRACWPQLKAYALGEGTKEDLDEALTREYNPFLE